MAQISHHGTSTKYKPGWLKRSAIKYCLIEANGQNTTVHRAKQPLDVERERERESIIYSAGFSLDAHSLFWILILIAF